MSCQKQTHFLVDLRKESERAAIRNRSRLVRFIDLSATDYHSAIKIVLKETLTKIKRKETKAVLLKTAEELGKRFIPGYNWVTASVDAYEGVKALIEFKAKCDAFQYVVRQRYRAMIKEELENSIKADKRLQEDDPGYNANASIARARLDTSIHTRFFNDLCKAADTARKHAATRMGEIIAKAEHLKNLGYPRSLDRLQSKSKIRGYFADRLYDKLYESFLKKTDFFTHVDHAVSMNISIELVRIAALCAYMPHNSVNQNHLLNLQLGLTLFTNVTDDERKQLIDEFIGFDREFFHYLEYLYINNCSDFTYQQLRGAFVCAFSVTYEKYASPLMRGDSRFFSKEERIEADESRKMIQFLIERSLFMSKSKSPKASESQLLHDAMEKNEDNYKRVLYEKINEFLTEFGGKFLNSDERLQIEGELFADYTSFSNSTSLDREKYDTEYTSEMKQLYKKIIEDLRKQVPIEQIQEQMINEVKSKKRQQKK